MMQVLLAIKALGVKEASARGAQKEQLDVLANLTTLAIQQSYGAKTTSALDAQEKPTVNATTMSGVKKETAALKIPNLAICYVALAKPWITNSNVNARKTVNAAKQTTKAVL